MKTPEEYIIGLDFVSEECDIEILENPYEFNKKDIIRTIKQAQIEAYNQAIDDAVKNVTLKNKEIPYTGARAGGSYYIKVVDEESILKLKKQL